MKKIDRVILPAKEMEGMKIGLYVDSSETIYVSPSVYKLCQTDLELMRKHLKVLRMPKDENGSDRYETLAEWVENVQNKYS